MAEEKKEKNWWRKYTKKHLENSESDEPVQEAPTTESAAPEEESTAPEIDISDPFSELNTIMQRNLDGIIKNMFSRDVFRFPEMPATLKMDGGIFRKPRATVHETDKEVFVAIEMPGANKGNIKITVDGLNLIIDAQTKSEKKREGFSSSSYQGFRNIIRLPCEVLKKKAKAEYKQGILKVTLPKKEVSDEPGDIPIE
ncbi:MAG: Hsp20/alpha crystallin family protein [archaeon]